MTHPDRPPGDEQAPDEQGGVARWVLPYFEDSTLWPVLAVVLATIAAFIAPVLVSAVRDLVLLALAVTLLLVIGTVRLIRWEWRLRGRPGGIGVAALVVWALAASAAFWGARAGLL